MKYFNDVQTGFYLQHSIELILLDKDGRQLNREIIKLKVNTLGPTENYWFETGIYL